MTTVRIAPSEFVGRNIRDIASSQSLPEYETLRRDVAENGVREPVSFYYDESGKPVLLNGHTRVVIALELGLPELEAIARSQPTDSERILYQLSANHSVPLTAIDLARAYAALVADGLSQADVARRTGKSPAHVSQHVALLTLPREIQQRVARGDLSYRAAYELCNLPDEALDHPSIAAVKTVREAQRLRRTIQAAPNGHGHVAPTWRVSPPETPPGKSDEQLLAESYFEMALETLRQAVALARECELSDRSHWSSRIVEVLNGE